MPSLKDASETLEVEVEQRPYRIEDLSKRIDDAVRGVEGHVMSRKEGVMLIGIADEYQEELDAIDADIKNGQPSGNNE